MKNREIIDAHDMRCQILQYIDEKLVKTVFEIFSSKRLVLCQAAQ